MLGTQVFLIAAVDDDQEPGLLLRALEYSNNAQIAQNPLFGPVKSIFSGLNHGKQDVKNGLFWVCIECLEDNRGSASFAYFLIPIGASKQV